MRSTSSGQPCSSPLRRRSPLLVPPDDQSSSSTNNVRTNRPQPSLPADGRAVSGRHRAVRIAYRVHCPRSGAICRKGSANRAAASPLVARLGGNFDSGAATGWRGLGNCEIADAIARRCVSWCQRSKDKPAFFRGNREHPIDIAFAPHTMLGPICGMR